MAVSAVQNQTENLRKKSLLLSGATGAVAAYTLKWAIPVLPWEKDDFYKSEQLNVQKKSEMIATQEIEALRTNAKQINGADEFVKMYDEKKIDLKDSSKSLNEMSDDVIKIYSKILSKMQDSKATGIDTLKTMTKRIRPTLAFVLLGLGAGVFSAVYHNVYVTNVKNNVTNFETYS